MTFAIYQCDIRLDPYFNVEKVNHRLECKTSSNFLFVQYSAFVAWQKESFHH